MPQIIDHRNFTAYKAKLSIRCLWFMFTFLSFCTISRIAYGIDRFTNIDHNFIHLLHDTIPLGIINWTFFILLLINWYFHSRWFSELYLVKKELSNDLPGSYNQEPFHIHIHRKLPRSDKISVWSSWFIPFFNIITPTSILLEINKFHGKYFPSDANKVNHYILIWALLFTSWYLLYIILIYISPFFPEDYELQYSTKILGLELLIDSVQLISIPIMILIIKKMSKFKKKYFANYNFTEISEHLTNQSS